MTDKYIPSKGEHFKAYTIEHTDYPYKQFGYQPRVFKPKRFGHPAINAEHCICKKVYKGYLDAIDGNKDERKFDFHEFLFEKIGQ